MSRRRISNLIETNPGLRNLPVLLHRRITYPLANLILLLVGVPFILRSRGASLFVPALAAMGVCAAYFVVDTVGCDLASRGIVPAAVGAWAAVVLFGAAGVTLLDSMHGEG
jgi:lipopolysaccharide export LptBFGC system permease protein LptF